MAMFPVQTSFAAGEISPSLYARPDLAKYGVGLRRCENFIVHPYGGISKRGGTKYICNSKNNGACRLVPFVYSVDQAYMLEFGDKYVRFIKSSELIYNGDNVYELTTPFAAADVNALAFTQSADVLYITHPDYPPYELFRISDTNWVLQKFAFKNGPFKVKDEAYDGISMRLSAVSGQSVTLTADGTVFQAGHAGALFSLTHHVDEVSVKSSGQAASACTDSYLTALDGVVDPDSQTGRLALYISTDVQIALFQAGRLVRFVGGSYMIPIASLTAHGSGYIVRFTDIADTLGLDRDNTNCIPEYSAGDKVYCSVYTDSGSYWDYSVKAYKGWRLESGGFWGGTVYLDYWDADENRWVLYKTYISQVYPTGTTSSCGNAKNYSDQGTVDEPTLFRLRSSNFTQYVPDGNTDEDKGYFQLVAMETDHKAIVKVSYVTSGTVAVVSVLTDAASTNATVNWEEGSWSNVQGWPRAVGFYQERLAMGGTNSEPQTWWMSVVGDYYDFDVSYEAQDDELVSGTLVARQLEAIRFFVPLEKLVVLTYGGEWVVGSGAAGGAITPSNVDVARQGNRGCYDVEPIVIGNMVLFVQRQGARVRDLGYEFASDSFTGTDLTILARHLFEGHSIVDWAWAQEPDSVCWVVRDDGLLLAMTYVREQEVIAWSRMPMSGGALVESVASVPGTDRDAVYFVVNRSGKRTIEVLQPVGSNMADAIATYVVKQRYDLPQQVYVEGLPVPDGMTVNVIYNQKVVASGTCNSGVLSFSSAAGPGVGAFVQVGCSYTALAETLDLAATRQDGTQLTRRSRTAAVTARIENTRGLYVGCDVQDVDSNKMDESWTLSETEAGRLMPAKPADWQKVSGYAETSALTCDIRVGVPASYSKGRILLYAPGPYPCTVLGLVPEVEPGGPVAADS